MSGREGAVKAMTELFGPIIGITLVLMSVFYAGGFPAGPDRPDVPAVRAVIAATALISAVNAATLKPTQCALWLRLRCRRNGAISSIAGSTRLRRGRAPLRRPDPPHGRSQHADGGGRPRSDRRGVLGMTRVPTAFIPIEDQGYLMVNVQLPDGASLQRTDRVLQQITKIARDTPGVDVVFSITGVSGARQQCKPAQRRRGLRDAQGLVGCARRPRARTCSRCFGR